MLACCTLRRCKNERKIRMLRNITGRAVNCRLPNIFSAFTGAMQEQDQGPSLSRFCLIIFGQKKQVIKVDALSFMKFERFDHLSLVKFTWRDGVAASQGQQQYRGEQSMVLPHI